MEILLSGGTQVLSKSTSTKLSALSINTTITRPWKYLLMYVIFSHSFRWSEALLFNGRGVNTIFLFKKSSVCSRTKKIVCKNFFYYFYSVKRHKHPGWKYSRQWWCQESLPGIQRLGTQKWSRARVTRTQIHSAADVLDKRGQHMVCQVPTGKSQVCDHQ